MPAIPTESTFELNTIERFRHLGYRHRYGSDLAREAHQVVLEDELREYLRRRYRRLPQQAVELAIQVISSPQGADVDRRNLHFQRLLREGYILRYEDEGEERFQHIYYLDFENHQPELNNFLVVNQLTVQGAAGAAAGNTRRLDIVIYVNGLPLVVFELKNPWDAYTDVLGAYNQLQHYRVDISQVFDFNAFCVVSDGVTTLHGMAGAGFEWFSPWKSIDGEHVEPNTTGSMKTLVEGLFPKDRLLDYVRNFIVHEVVNDKVTKKGAKYHQFFAVQLAAGKAISALTQADDRRVGVIWHTQGSGKSLSMIFLTAILRRSPGLNPTILVQVDRNDLDNQLYDSFIAANELVGAVQQAGDVDDLRRLFATEGGEVICSTIEKFRLREGENRHPVLSPRRNILIMADEAHRTQYNLLDGFAAYLRQALPNASYLGFTGTPIDREDANTVQLFGETLHTYDMQQAKEDNAVVGLFYEARHIPLDLANKDIDADLAAITGEVEPELPEADLETAKAKWAAMEQASGTKQRLATLAADMLDHFRKRQQVLKGKAMIVCMSRRNAVGLYQALMALPGCPEIKVVMTGNLAADPVAWSQAGHITTHARREQIKARFVDPEDPLQIVIVCDMWLTGFDAPCANTLYVDKPMKGHTLMQAIARVNRVFRDKPAGLIVDYIGIADQLKAATRKYTAGGGDGVLAEDLEAQAVDYFLHQLEATRSNLPQGMPYAIWRDLSSLELEDLTSLCYGVLTADQERLDDFLADEKRLAKSFSLVRHLPVAESHIDEVAYYQLVRKNLRKTQTSVRQSMEAVERAVLDLLDDSVAAQPAVDIFAVSGLDKPNIAILDEGFLAGFRQSEHQDVQIRLLEKLLRDDLELHRRGNLIQYRSFREMLDQAITRYNNRSIEAADVVQVMIEIRQQQLANERRKQELGLSDEELAFYDVIVAGAPQGLPTDNVWIASLVRDVVRAVKSNVKVDWTRAHRQDVQASVESAVKQVLRRRGVKGEQFRFLINRLMQQAKASYEAWPLAA